MIINTPNRNQQACGSMVEALEKRSRARLKYCRPWVEYGWATVVNKPEMTLLVSLVSDGSLLLHLLLVTLRLLTGSVECTTVRAGAIRRLVSATYHIFIYLFEIFEFLRN
uniref:Uncharacterized protein n=1 Tax=Schistocephalus solidus TaxID=70667 RepID=A0A0X3NSR9_SCHSO